MKCVLTRSCFPGSKRNVLYILIKLCRNNPLHMAHLFLNVSIMCGGVDFFFFLPHCDCKSFTLICGENSTYATVQGCPGSKLGIWHFIPSLQSSCIIYDHALNSLAQGSPSCKQIRAFRGSLPAV